MRLVAFSLLLLVVVATGAQAAERSRVTWWGERLYSPEDEMREADKIAIVWVERVTPIGYWHLPDVPPEEQGAAFADKLAEYDAALRKNPRMIREELVRGTRGWSRIADAHVEEAVAGSFDERMYGIGGMKLGCGIFPSVAGNEILNACHGGASLQANKQYLIMVKPMGEVYAPLGASSRSVNIGYYPIENGLVRGFGRRIRPNDTSDAIPLADALQKIRTVRRSSGISTSTSKGIWTPDQKK